jgi:hypothetical protein
LIWKKIRNGSFDWGKFEGILGDVLCVSDACRCGFRFGLNFRKYWSIEQQKERFIS